MATVIPNFTTFENLAASATVANNGIAEVSVTYYANTLATAMNFLKTGESCPLLGSLLRSAIFKYGTMEKVIDEVYQVTLHWRGVSLRYNLEDTILQEYHPAGNTEPIATHPRFKEFAGTWGNRSFTNISNPDWDKEGRFIKFARYLADGSRNPFAGTEAYYLAGLVVSDFRVLEENQVSENDQYSVGKIDVPELRDLPTFRTDIAGVESVSRNYLLTSIQLENYNNGLVGVTREWRLSGPWGWDDDIYDYTDTGENIS